MRQEVLLLDACVTINLMATDRLGEIAESLNLSFVVAEQVAAEAGHLRELIDGKVVVTPIDLHKQVAAGHLAIVGLSSAELPTYVELAAIVDDGEAASIAIALHRELPLATDDRKARRLCTERGLAEPRRTLDLLHAYADVAAIDSEACRELLAMVRQRASFLPPRADPWRTWWSSHLG
jgi:predicted nucleic acid-binding protein